MTNRTNYDVRRIPNHTHIIVFQDGETWSTLDGCKIIVVNDDGFEEIEASGDPHDVSRDNVLAVYPINVVN